jgi:hypothetical protein
MKDYLPERLNVRKNKLYVLAALRRRERLLTERIEILEDELELLGWKPRKVGMAFARPAYSNRVIDELIALPVKERARRIREMATAENIELTSVYRKLQTCSRWTMRNRDDPAWASKSYALFNSVAKYADVA